MYYRLEGHTPIKCEDLVEAFSSERRVAIDQIGDEYEVSTVFLVVNHSLTYSDIPVLFETMVFGLGELADSDTGWDGYQIRYSTWDKAVEGHNEIVRLIKSRQPPED